jgi:hypothetical protein
MLGTSQEMNTGMLLLRSSPGAIATCLSWVERMRKEMVSIRRLPKNMLQWWSNDQTFFNEVLHRGRQSFAADRIKGGDAEAEEALLASTRHPRKRESLRAAFSRLRAMNGHERAAVRGA